MSKTYQKPHIHYIKYSILSLLHLSEKPVVSPSLLMEMDEDIAWSMLLKYYVKPLGK